MWFVSFQFSLQLFSLSESPPFRGSICHHTKAGLSLDQQIKLDLFLLSLAYFTIFFFPLPLPTPALLPHSLLLTSSPAAESVSPHCSAPDINTATFSFLLTGLSWLCHGLPLTHLPHDPKSSQPAVGLLCPVRELVTQGHHSPFASHMAWVH